MKLPEFSIYGSFVIIFSLLFLFLVVLSRAVPFRLNLWNVQFDTSIQEDVNDPEGSPPLQPGAKTGEENIENDTSHAYNDIVHPGEQG